MPTEYETDVLAATREELRGGRLLELTGITVQDVELVGSYPGTEIVVSYTQDDSEYQKTFKLYNRSYPGEEEFPDAGNVAAIIATNVAD